MTLSVELKSECILVTDDTFLFLVVHDVNISKNDQNSGLQKIYELAYQWKMKFNPDASKQTQKISFSTKVLKPFPPDVHFDNDPNNSTPVRKLVEIILDFK